MGIELITPGASNFLKDFPSQNAVNMDRIDDYAGPSLISHPLQSYTPILDSTFIAPSMGSGGSAVNRAYFYEIFDYIYVWGEFRFGSSGMSVGGGIYTMTLPFRMESIVGITNNPGNTPVIGTGSVWANASASRQSLTVHPRTNTTIMFAVRMNSGMPNRELSHNVPLAWAAGEGWTWNARYQRLP